MRTRRFVALLCLLTGGSWAESVLAQQVTYEERGGVKYQVTTQKVMESVPVTVMQERQQTIYAPQYSTQNVTHQQTYVVPVTQYQTVATLHGRWNPFVTPYWTYSVEPVTTWQSTVANVQIPVNQVAWQPQTQTVQVPVTEYRTAERVITTTVAVSNTNPATNSNQSMASTVPAVSTTPSVTSLPAGPSAYSAPAANSYPSATIATRPSVTSSTPLGGTIMESDPPRQPTSNWSTPPGNSRRY